MQPVGSPNDTPASLRRKAREFLRLAEAKTATGEAVAELKLLGRQYLDYADFLEKNAPGEHRKTPPGEHRRK
jgi:hypothetical protein